MLKVATWSSKRQSTHTRQIPLLNASARDRAACIKRGIYIMCCQQKRKCADAVYIYTIYIGEKYILFTRIRHAGVIQGSLGYARSPNIHQTIRAIRGPSRVYSRGFQHTQYTTLCNPIYLIYTSVEYI